MFGLTPDIIRNVKEAFSKLSQIEKVILYGSRAKGNYKDGSDIDITLLGENLNLKTVYALEAAIDELYLPYTFDISIFTQIDNDDLIEHILSVGKVFYVKKNVTLPKGWEVKMLTDVCVVERGSSPRPIKNFITDSIDGVNWIKIGDTKTVEKYIYSTKEKITKEGAKKSRYVKEGDFILSNSMSFGKPYIMKTDGYIHDGWFVLRLHDFINTEYFFQLLSSPYVNDQFHKLASGSVVKNISGDLVKKVVLPIPPFPEQKRIVALLDKAFAAMAKAKANAEQNLKNAKELFESYLQGVFENKGDGWDERTLGDLCKRVSVGHVGPTSKFYCDESIGIPFLRSQNVRSGRLDWKGVQYITKEFHDKIKKSQLLIDDILFVRVGAKRGDCCVIKEKITELNCANIVFARLKEGNVDFIDKYCQSQVGRNQLLGMSVGAAQGVINTKSVAELIIPYPPLKEQETIVKKLNALSGETKKLEAIYQQKLEDLEELKKSVLQKAFNGELT